MDASEDLAAVDSELVRVNGHLAALQTVLDDLIAQRRQLWTRRNALVSPICCLPVELVHNIVEHLVTPAFDLPDDLSAPPLATTSAPTVDGRALVAGLCTHLRAVVLASGHLWAQIHWTKWGKKWQNICIERAGSSPLHIHVTASKRDYNDYQPLSACMVRTHTLVVNTAQAYTGPRALHLMFDQPAPLLRAFSYAGVPQEWRNFQLTDRFMGGHTVSLTHLMLAHIWLSVPGLRIPTLVHLDLHHCRFDAAALEAVFALLAAAKQLKRLFLTDVVLSPQSLVISPQELPTLPCLSYIGLSGSLLVLSTLIARLPIPMQGYIMNDDDRTLFESDVRLHVFGQALLKLGLPLFAHETSLVPVLNLHCKGRGKPHHHCLLVERPGVRGGITYEDHCEALDDCSTILDHARALRVHGTDAFNELFVYATRPVDEEDQALAALEHLVLEDFDSPLYDFSDWLARRARAGRPLKSVDFCGKKSYVVRFGTVAELGRQMVVEGVVEQVLIDGQPLGA